MVYVLGISSLGVVYANQFPHHNSLYMVIESILQVAGIILFCFGVYALIALGAYNMLIQHRLARHRRGPDGGHDVGRDCGIVLVRVRRGPRVVVWFKFSFLEMNLYVFKYFNLFQEKCMRALTAGSLILYI